MKSLTLLIKPSSSICDLDCKYCFYKDFSHSKSVYNIGFMTISNLEKIGVKAFYEDCETINFIFQGGELTLVGLGFYKNLIYLQNTYNKKILKYKIQYRLTVYC